MINEILSFGEKQKPKSKFNPNIIQQIERAVEKGASRNDIIKALLHQYPSMDHTRALEYVEVSSAKDTGDIPTSNEKNSLIHVTGSGFKDYIKKKFGGEKSII